MRLGRGGGGGERRRGENNFSVTWNVQTLGFVPGKVKLVSHDDQQEHGLDRETLCE